MRALVTGASGFIGWHLARVLLARGDEPIGFVRKTSNTGPLDELEIQLAYGDISDVRSLQRAMSDVDVVFHLAGLTKAIDPETLFRVNRDGTQAVAEACLHANVDRLVCVSSLAAVGPAAGKDQPLVESDVARPVSHYGRSKLAGEEAALQMADRLSVRIVRPPIVVGEHDPASVQMFRSIYRSRIHAVPGFRSHPYSVIHAEDLANLLWLVAKNGSDTRPDSLRCGTGIYFAEHRERPTYAELGNLIASAIGRKCIKVPIGPLVLRGAGWFADRVARFRGRAEYFSSDKVREALSGPWICNAAKARDELQFDTPEPLAQQIQRTGKWFAENGWL